MKTRIIVAAIGIPILLALIFFAPIWVVGIAVGVIAAGAAWELLRCTAPTASVRIRIYAAMAAAAIPIGDGMGFEWGLELAAAFLLFLLLFCELMLTFKNEKPMSFTVVATALLAGAIVPMFLSSLVRLGKDGFGPLYMLLPFIAAFSSDSGAYFTGLALGRHKLAPHISPNKTIEGSVGGFVFAAAFMLIYGLILEFAGYSVSFPVIAVYGFFGSLAGQIGDLSFSSIKRECGIKDYGNIIPGHGGILDRFDSIIFVAPAMELLVLLIPAIS